MLSAVWLLPTAVCPCRSRNPDYSNPKIARIAGLTRFWFSRRVELFLRSQNETRAFRAQHLVGSNALDTEADACFRYLDLLG